MPPTLIYQEQIKNQDAESLAPAYSNPSRFDHALNKYLYENLNELRAAIEAAMGPDSQWDAPENINKRITHKHSGGDQGPVLIDTSSTPLVWSGSGVAGSGGADKKAAPYDHQHPNYLLSKYVYRRHSGSVVLGDSVNNINITDGSGIAASVPPISSSADAVGVISESLPPTIATNNINCVNLYNAADNTPILDTNRPVYGRVSTTGSPGSYTHTLYFYLNNNGTEEAVSLGGITLRFDYIRQYEWDSIVASGTHKDILLFGGGSSGAGGDTGILEQHLSQLREDLYTTPSWSADGSGILVTPLETQIATLSGALAGKEDSLGTGQATDYLNGLKQWVAFPTSLPPTDHDLLSAHTASGLISGHVLKATGPTAFGFGQLAHSQLGGVGADDHHAKSHGLDSAADHTGTLSWSKLNKSGSSLADLATRSIGNLSDVAIAAPTQGHYLSYNNSLSRWENVAFPGTMIPSDHGLVSTTHTVAGLTIGHVLRATGAAAYAFGQAQHGDLGGVAADQHHAQQHTLTGTDHTVSGLTIGHFLKATGATTFGFAAHGLTYSDVGAAASGHNHSGVYEPVINAGTSGDYWRGDKSWQPLNAAAVGLGNVTNNAQVWLQAATPAVTQTGGLAVSGEAKADLFYATTGFAVHRAPGGSQYRLRTAAGLTRFALGLVDTEAGDNSGSNLILWAYQDDGITPITPLKIDRATGDVTLSRAVSMGNTNSTGYINATQGFRQNGAAPSGQYLRGNGTNFVASALRAEDVPTLNQSTTGYATTLIADDNRIAVPNEFPKQRARFGFGTFNNNNASPYADYLNLESYAHNSGGTSNFLVFNKSNWGARFFRKSWADATTQSADAYSDYRDFALVENSQALNVLPKWTQVANGSMLGASRVSDDGTTIGLGGNAVVEGTLAGYQDVTLGQHPTLNQQTTQHIYPSGTNTSSRTIYYGKSNATDAPFASIGHDGTNFFLHSTKNGAGVAGDLLFYLDGTEILRIAQNRSLRWRGSLTNNSTRPAIAAVPTGAELRAHSSGSLSQDDGFLRISAGGGTNTNQQTFIDLSGYSNVVDMNNTLTFGVGGLERARFNNLGRLNVYYDLLVGETPGQNRNSTLHVVPGGINTTANIYAYGGSDRANSGWLGLTHNGTNAILNSSKTGTGVTRDLLFQTAGLTRMSITAAGDVKIGSLSGLLKATSGTVSAIAAGNAGQYLKGDMTWENFPGPFEYYLGNPDTDGKVLASTALGVRSWVSLPSSTFSGSVANPCIPFAIGPNNFANSIMSQTHSNHIQVYGSLSAYGSLFAESHDGLAGVSGVNTSTGAGVSGWSTTGYGGDFRSDSGDHLRAGSGLFVVSNTGSVTVAGTVRSNTGFDVLGVAGISGSIGYKDQSNNNRHFHVSGGIITADHAGVPD
jgi:hypothetical protein